MFLFVLVVVVLGHWAEHVLQAAQIWWLGWAPGDAGGALGLAAPSLAHSEVLHVAYNLAILIGIAALLRAFPGPARRWWTAALAAQSWHAIEHLLLVWQEITGGRPFGTAAPSSLVQLVVPRVELHLGYNTVVTALMAVALCAAGFIGLPLRRKWRRDASTQAAGRVDSDDLPAATRGRLWPSTYGGVTGDPVLSGTMTLAAYDLRDAGRAVVAHVADGKGVLVSEDPRATWTPAGWTAGEDAVASIAVHPTDEQTVMVTGTDGGDY